MRRKFQRRRRGIFVVFHPVEFTSSVRNGIIGSMPNIPPLTGLDLFRGLGFYKDFAPTALALASRPAAEKLILLKDTSELAAACAEVPEHDGQDGRRFAGNAAEVIVNASATYQKSSCRCENCNLI